MATMLAQRQRGLLVALGIPGCGRPQKPNAPEKRPRWHFSTFETTLQKYTTGMPNREYYILCLNMAHTYTIFAR